VLKVSKLLIYIFTFIFHTSYTHPANTCHDELDNLLSEMLLTVEALPDIAYSTEKSKQNSDVYKATTVATTTNNTASMRSNAVDRTLPNNNQLQSTTNVINNINTTNDQRSQTRSYSYSDAFGYSKNNDIGETSSITTTLTPTESGRNTPALSDQQYKGFYTNNDELYYDTDTQMQLHGKSTRYQHSLPDDTRKEYQKRSENLLQNQSLGYMEVLRSENNISGSRRYEESNVPYHAREYSKPFSYLPSTADGKIIRMQHGLSSPSMVRKALNLNGSVTSGRKNLSQDFVERTRYGRQYESKYTFGDKTPENNLSVFDNEKLFDYRNKSENVKYKDSANYSIENSDVESSAHYFEPLKRSNTMDGSFGRSGYASDG